MPDRPASAIGHPRANVRARAFFRRRQAYASISYAGYGRGGPGVIRADGKIRSSPPPLLVCVRPPLQSTPDIPIMAAKNLRDRLTTPGRGLDALGRTRRIGRAGGRESTAPKWRLDHREGSCSISLLLRAFCSGAMASRSLRVHARDVTVMPYICPRRPFVGFVSNSSCPSVATSLILSRKTAGCPPVFPRFFIN